MADQPRHDQRHSAGENYSTLKTVQHHPDMNPVSPQYSTLEVSPRVDEGKFSEASPKTEKSYWQNYGQSPPSSPHPASPKVDDTRFSTLEAYQNPNTPISPDKTEAGIGANVATSAEPKKENWKRRRICGIPLVFLVIGLVVVLAVIGAVVGGVVGSRKKDDPKPTPISTPILTPNSTNADVRPKDQFVLRKDSKAVSTQTSAPFFGDTIVYRLWRVGNPELRLEDSAVRDRTPEDCVFMGVGGAEEGKFSPEERGMQLWELKSIPKEYLSGITYDTKTNGPFWFRMWGTDLVLSLDEEVRKSIFDAPRTNESRKDIPAKLKPFNQKDKNRCGTWVLFLTTLREKIRFLPLGYSIRIGPWVCNPITRLHCF